MHWQCGRGVLRQDVLALVVDLLTLVPQGDKLVVSLVQLDRVVIVIVEFFKSLKEVSLSVQSSLRLFVNLSLTSLLVTLGKGLASDDVLLSQSDSRRQPFEKLTKARVVSVHLFLSVIVNQLLAEVKGFVASVCALLLTEHLIVSDTRSKVFEVGLSMLPEEAVRGGFTNVTPLDLHEEHQALDDAGHLDHVKVTDLVKTLV